MNVCSVYPKSEVNIAKNGEFHWEGGHKSTPLYGLSYSDFY